MLIRSSQLKRIETSSKLHTQLTEARVFASIASTLLSYMMFRCKISFLDASDTQIDTAAAGITGSGNFIYINEGFWQKLTPKQRAFLILHEVLHIYLDHGTRAVEMQYDVDLWNIATDYNINSTCSGWYKSSTGVTKTNERYAEYLEWIPIGIRDELYIGMSSDEIYHLLKQSSEQQPQPMDPIILADLDDESTDEQLATQKAKNIQTSIAAVENAKASNAIGDNELGVVKTFDKLKEPKVKWQDKVTPVLVSSAPIYQTYNRLSRKTSGGVVFPTFTGNSINLFLGIDTSGSVSTEQTVRFVSEIKGLLESFSAYTVQMYSCDAEVYPIGEFTESDGFDSIDWSLLKGGGGTLMQKLVKKAQRLQSEGEPFDLCVIFTDGYLWSDDIKATDFDGRILVIIPEGGHAHLEIKDVEIVTTF